MGLIAPEQPLPALLWSLSRQILHQTRFLLSPPAITSVEIINLRSRLWTMQQGKRSRGITPRSAVINSESVNCVIGGRIGEKMKLRGDGYGKRPFTMREGNERRADGRNRCSEMRECGGAGRGDGVRAEDVRSTSLRNCPPCVQ